MIAKWSIGSPPNCRDFVVKSLRGVVWIRQPVSTCFVDRKVHDRTSIADVFLSLQIDLKVERLAEWLPTLHWHRVVMCHGIIAV